MADNENTMELEINPYDHLVEKSDVPVQSPVILKNKKKTDVVRKGESTIEISPMAEASSYDKVTINEYKTIYSKDLEIEEELIVPDIYPDVETILNTDGNVDFTDIVKDNGLYEFNGKINLEVMYKSVEQYGSNISVVETAIKFNGKIDNCNLENFKQVHVNAKAGRVEYRIINERKYRVKIHVHVEVKGHHERDLWVFNGIEGENLFLKKSNINLLNFVSQKSRESEIRENMLINDEKIRPVKILKARAEIAENHSQLTKDKLIVNQTIWVRIVYLAEISSKGNLSNQPMFFHGKIDNTQFINSARDDMEVALCRNYSYLDNVSIEVNKESNGFDVNAEIITDVEYFNCIEKEFVIDFYHEKEEMTCDHKSEKICTNFNSISIEQSLKESISLQQESGDEHRIIYMDSQITDQSASIEGNTLLVRGKLHIEIVTMNEGDYTILARKICDFSCMKELPQDVKGCLELDRVFVREMKCDILGKEVNVTALLQANLYLYDESELNLISNPCIIKNGEHKKYYPITIHTVMEGESLWEIGKKYKVAEECIRAHNKEDQMQPGSKIIIVK